jgi:DNA-binding transcriptional regulator YiaG
VGENESDDSSIDRGEFQMKIFSAINSIGGGLRATSQATSQLPESIVIEALGSSIDHPIIPGQILAILQKHGRLFEKNVFEKLLTGLLNSSEPQNQGSLIFSYSVLQKTGMLSDKMAVGIAGTICRSRPDLYFGGDYERLARMATTIATPDPEILHLGFAIPEIKPAHLKSIVINPLEFSHLNTHMKKRVCQACGSRTTELPMRESKLLQSLGSAFTATGSRATYKKCASCGVISKTEMRRLSTFQKKATAKIVRECIFMLKRDYKVKELVIAERIGISPEHLSNLKHGNYLPSATLLRLLVTQTKIAVGKFRLT